MATRSMDYAAEWLEHDGKKVVVDGLAYTLKVESWVARYPYEQEVVRVSAELCNKRSKAYLSVKEELGDDWSTDVLGSDVEVESKFLQAARTTQLYTCACGSEGFEPTCPACEN